METLPPDMIRKPNVADVIADAIARENATPDVTLNIPVKTISELNDHSHWRERQRRAASQDQAVRICASAQGVREKLKGLYPCLVKFTRVSPGNGLDLGDNLNSSFKHIRDSVCDLIGVKDGNKSEYQWDYDQKRGGKGEYAVIVEVTRIKD